jgi:hypothetical protein
MRLYRDAEVCIGAILQQQRDHLGVTEVRGHCQRAVPILSAQQRTICILWVSVSFIQ